MKAGLERECRAYSRYLIGRDPDEYITGKYIECHELGLIPEARDSFERFLSAVSVRGRFQTRMADAYANRLLRYGALRKKLVLMLALLECSPGAYESLDSVDGGGFWGTAARGTWRATVFVAALGCGMVLFLPARAMARGR